MLMPIQDYENKPLVPLEEATESGVVYVSELYKGWRKENFQSTKQHQLHYMQWNGSPKKIMVSLSSPDSNGIDPTLDKSWNFFSREEKRQNVCVVVV